MSYIKPVALVILDGFGYSKDAQCNAIVEAHTPTLDTLLSVYPHTLLKASGQSVGLLPGTMGNSEVGHLTIGAGRVVVQPSAMIHNAIQDGSFFTNKLLQDTLHSLSKTKKLHIMGLLSDSNVHSNIEQLYAFIKAARNAGIKQIIIHPFLDGRDVAPRSAAVYLEQLQAFLDAHEGIIGSLVGRFYAMDRDKNWERTKQCYEALTEQGPICFASWRQAISYCYDQNITDEFVPPIQLSHDGVIVDGDGVIFFNFRADRARQLIRAFIDPEFDEFKRILLNLAFFITPTGCGLVDNVTIFPPKNPIVNTLKEVLSNAGKSIFTIAETEKYAHVTYFFNGGREGCVSGEDQLLIQSIRAKNYIEHPEMSAQAITDAVLKSLQTNPHDFYLINYANADMVGHSGDFQATVKAIEVLDQQIKQLFDSIVTKMHGTLYITADHGNAEEKWDSFNQQVHTAHTANPVPFIMASYGFENSFLQLPIKTLADIAPFIITNMGLQVPQEMAIKNA